MKKTEVKDTVWTILCLLAIGLAGLILTWQGQFPFAFSLSVKGENSIGLMPLFLTAVVGGEFLLSDPGSRERLKVVLYLIFFIFICPRWDIGVAYILLMGLFYGVHLLGRRFSIGKSLLFTSLVIVALVPLALYSFRFPLTSLQVITLIIFKSCLLMRLISWWVDREVYHRENYNGLLEFLEFIFCPIFFVFPGQIQFFLFNYFHQSKTAERKKNHYKSCLWLALWGYGLMLTYSYFDQLFWNHTYQIPQWINQQGFWATEMTIGFYWLFVIYFQQAAGMSFQVSVGRLLGYNIKYDMHWALFSRSPLEYLRRHSSYVKDYVVEVGLRPMALFLMRKKERSYWMIPVVSVVSYVLLVGLQTGFRPDYHRNWKVTSVMIAFLVFAITLPYLRMGIVKMLKLPANKAETLLADDIDQPFFHWKLLDYVMWIGTLISLAAYKMFLGLAKGL